MAKWEFKPTKVEDGYDCYWAECGLNSLYLYKMPDYGDNYYELHYFRGALLTINQRFVASNWESAKAQAIFLVRDYLREQCEYWKGLKISFANWYLED